MGYEQRHALVSMTNKDVYYLTTDAAKELKKLIAEHFGREPLAFFETVDAKSGSTITVSIGNVSSIVIPKGGSRA